MEVIREVPNSAKPEDGGIDVKFIRRIATGGILVELGAQTDRKNTFCETVQGILGSRACVPW